MCGRERNPLAVIGVHGVETMVKKVFHLYEGAVEQYPVRGVVLSNVLFASLLVAGTAACWLIAPEFGIVYLVVFSALTYAVLRRLTCTRCHYFGKRCGSGWGLLASMWCSRRPIEEFNDSPGVRLAPLVYGLMILVPLFALGILLAQHATTTPLLLLALLISLAFYSAGPGRRRACAVCKMRLFCKGSAAR